MKNRNLPGVVETLIFVMLLISAVCAKNAGRMESKTKPGIEVLLEEKVDLVKGKRVGLITNPTGVNSQLETTIDLLYNHPDINLVALFGPEHGVRGDVMAGEKIDNFVDKKTGVPVYSLYGKTRKPTPEMLKDVDVLIYDIQDIGSRAYTYIYTMALGMEAAAETSKPFIVLDRPNPLGGNLIEGPVLDPAFKSFIGMYPIPFVYGLTVGELAQLFNKEFDINADLTVVPMKGWTREMTFEDTGLEWVITSPHIPHGKTAFFCAATGVIGELHTIDIGIGYTLPFELIGEEWINASEFAEELNSYNLPGVVFRPLHYRPYYFTRQNIELQGVQIHIRDIDKFQPMRTQIYILSAIRKLYPDRQIFDTKRSGMFDKAMGTDEVRNALINREDSDKIIGRWQKDLKKFKKIRQKYLIY